MTYDCHVIFFYEKLTSKLAFKCLGFPKVKDSLRDDPRYKSVKHEDREVLFNEYISDLRAAEEEVEREAKAKRDEQVRNHI